MDGVVYVEVFVCVCEGGCCIDEELLFKWRGLSCR